MAEQSVGPHPPSFPGVEALPQKPKNAKVFFTL